MGKKVEVKVTTRGVGKVNRAIASIGTKFDRLKRDVKRAGASLVTFKNAAVIAGSAIALKKAFDFVEMGASIEKQRAAFESLAKSHGSSADKILSNLKRISRGTVDTVSLMQSANKALLLGIDPGQFTKLMEIARAASKATGDTVTKSFEDITVGIGRQSKLILDNLGIIVKVGDANKKYAAKLGKAASALTDAEKKQAFLNATVEAGQAIIDGVGKDTDSTSDAIDRFKVSIKEATDELRELASAGLNGVIEAVEELNVKLESTSKIAEKIPVEKFGLLAAAARGGKLPGDVPGTPAYELKQAKEAARRAQNYAAYIKKAQIKGVAVPSVGEV